MTLQELIAEFRLRANDRVEPFFWDDQAVAGFLNEAEQEAAIRGRLLLEMDDPEICRIEVVAGRSVYPLHPALYELSHLSFQATGGKRVTIELLSVGEMDVRQPGWRDAMAVSYPRFGIQSDKWLRLAPEPDLAGELRLEGYRVPKEPMALDDQGTATPELNAIHHVHLVEWALYRAFSIPDTEAFDATRSASAEQAFTDYFGIRPDADLRRSTREDVPHYNRAFWP